MPVIFLLNTDSYKLKMKFGSEKASIDMTSLYENWHVNTIFLSPHKSCTPKRS